MKKYHQASPIPKRTSKVNFSLPILTKSDYNKMIPPSSPEIMPVSSYTPIQKTSFSRKFPQIFVNLSAVLLILFLGERIVNDPLFRVQAVNISGEEQLSDSSIRHLSNIRFNQHLFLLDEEQAEHWIKEHPWVSDATVRTTFPNIIEIEVVEQQPTMLLALEKLWYVNQDGDIFREANKNDLNYPIVTGIPQKWKTQHSDILVRVLHEALLVEQACDVPLLGGSENISEINFHTKTGFRVILRNGVIITFGFYKPEGRVDRLRKMIKKGLDISIPQKIILDADTVAISKPLTKLE
jgi:hypothetical protein